ncbi:hypothetical protein BKA56DRAFT_737351 [Ilyonectria sp. MPI-CAGE-AT-0026]|nr:hypothetical protein BKA56DRAFT_737351 [Ilyonectria sp. MPI-CAGE-AT-0026]
MLKTGLIVGSGRQSVALVNLLSSTKQLAALANVEIVFNSAGHGYDLDAFLAAASRSDFVFVNTDGFQLGEQAETYWGIRLFELSRKAYVEHFIYSGLDYASRNSGFDPSLYIGHYEGKARVQYLGVATGHASGLDIANAFANITAKPAQALLQTYGENFTAWWNLYKASAWNEGLIQ